MTSLESDLAARTGPAAPELVDLRSDGKIRCLACGHRCLLPDGKRGICKVRFRVGSELRVPRGYVAGLQVDPIEKKPFFHVLPGREALSFGMLGCDLHCAYCQNWISSQALRDRQAETGIQTLSARSIVDLAVRRGVPVVTSTYNEPLITAEWAAEIFDLAKERGLLTSIVSNGNATKTVLDFLARRLDLVKIDLKSFRQDRYRELGGQLSHVLATIEGAVARGLWLEVVTLLVPGFNDTEAELRDITRFLAGVSPDIPWHVTAFHPDYRMKDRSPTRAESVLLACDIGREEGLTFVYPGNLRGIPGNREDTLCPSCGVTLVSRHGYRVRPCRVRPDGRCPDCGTLIPGRFEVSALPPAPGTGINPA